jgi:hypothetical protein
MNTESTMDASAPPLDFIFEDDSPTGNAPEDTNMIPFDPHIIQVYNEGSFIRKEKKNIVHTIDASGENQPKGM